MLIALIFAITYCVPNPYSCKNIEEPECEEIMWERYALTVDDYNNMFPLHQAIMSDNLGCVRENKCPLHIPRIEGKEHRCLNGESEGYPCHDVVHD